MPRATFRSTEHQLDLDRYGFTVVDLLDDSELQAVRQVWAGAGAAPDDPRGSIHFGFFSSDTAWKRSVTTRIADVVKDRLGQIFDEQIIYFSMFVTKWPSELGAFGPHQDPSFVDEFRHRTVTVWCPLQPTGEDNGQLHLVPGSHRMGPDVRVNDTSQFAHRASEQAILDRFGVAVPTRVGEGVVFDNRTVHYSYPNRSDAPRVVLAVGLRPAESECFHFEVARDDATAVDVMPIDDDYFIDMDPLRIQIEGVGRPPVRRIPRPGPSDPAEFAAAVLTAGVPAFSVPTSTETDWNVQYCFVCAGTDRLLTDPTAERGGMAVCESCLGHVMARYGESVAAEGVPPDAGPSAGAVLAGPDRRTPGSVGLVRRLLRRAGRSS